MLNFTLIDLSLILIITKIILFYYILPRNSNKNPYYALSIDKIYGVGHKGTSDTCKLYNKITVYITNNKGRINQSIRALLNIKDFSEPIKSLLTYNVSEHLDIMKFTFNVLKSINHKLYFKYFVGILKGTIQKLSLSDFLSNNNVCIAIVQNLVLSYSFHLLTYKTFFNNWYKTKKNIITSYTNRNCITISDYISSIFTPINIIRAIIYSTIIYLAIKYK